LFPPSPQLFLSSRTKSNAHLTAIWLVIASEVFALASLVSQAPLVRPFPVPTTALTTVSALKAVANVNQILALTTVQPPFARRTAMTTENALPIGAFVCLVGPVNFAMSHNVPVASMVSVLELGSASATVDTQARVAPTFCALVVHAPMVVVSLVDVCALMDGLAPSVTNPLAHHIATVMELATSLLTARAILVGKVQIVPRRFANVQPMENVLHQENVNVLLVGPVQLAASRFVLLAARNQEVTAMQLVTAFATRDFLVRSVSIKSVLWIALAKELVFLQENALAMTDTLGRGARIHNA